MRKQFVMCGSRYNARKQCPWASVIAKADGGYMAFESVTDYHIWSSQK